MTGDLSMLSCAKLGRTFKAGERIEYNLSAVDYLHHPAVSRSALVASYHWYQGKAFFPEKETPALTMGSAFHALINGEPVIITDRPKIDRRTKQGKKDYENWVIEHSNDDYILEPGQTETTMAMADALLKKLNRRFLYRSLQEVSLFWYDEPTELDMKARFDLWDPESRVIMDIKTIEDVSAPLIMKGIYTKAYHVQQVIYQRAALALTGEEHSFVFAFVSKMPPHVVRLVTLARHHIDKGLERLNSLVETYKASKVEAPPPEGVIVL